MDTYRVAILGCRGRGTAAARAYHAHPRCEVVGLCDLVPDLLETLGDELRVSERFADLDEMIESTEPDVVAIPTGTEFHYDLCKRVLDHGVHIEVEKPMCVDLEQADEILSIAEGKGVRVAVHHQGRVGAAMRTVQRAIGEGRIGDIRHLRASGKGYYGGYGLMNIGTHLINTMLGIVGPCRRVVGSARTADRPIGPVDVVPSPSGMGTIAGEHITATLDFDGGITATLIQHRFERMDSKAYGIEVLGTEGRLYWRSGIAGWLPHAHFLPADDESVWERLPLEHLVGYKGEDSAEEDYAFADEYVNPLDEDRDHVCSGSEGLHVLEVMMGIFESCAKGNAFELPQSNREHPLVKWRQEAGLAPPEEMPRGYWEWLEAEDRRLGREQTTAVVR